MIPAVLITGDKLPIDQEIKLILGSGRSEIDYKPPASNLDYKTALPVPESNIES